MRRIALAVSLLTSPALAQTAPPPDPQTVIQALAADHQESWQATIALRAQVITLTAKVAELQAQISKTAVKPTP